MKKRYTIYYTDGKKDVLYGQSKKAGAFGHGLPCHEETDTLLKINTGGENQILIPWHVIHTVSIMEVEE